MLRLIIPTFLLVQPHGMSQQGVPLIRFDVSVLYSLEQVFGKKNYAVGYDHYPQRKKQDS
jgi:hypothetical protein